MPTPPHPHEPGADAAEALSVTEEQLQVGRRVAESGRVRVRKHVDTEAVEAQADAVHEHVDVQRVRIDRVVAQPPVIRQEGDVTVVPVVEERLVTRKELVLVEEVRLTRRRDAVPRKAQLTLRRERVEIERFDPDTGQWRPEDEAASPQPKEQ